MKLVAEFLMPDYYPQFSCKMGVCRTACCEGWPISLSVADYFKLLGADCSPELRKKLDCGMHMVDHPVPESYAQISPRYDGECPMRMKDGRCGIQAELGEDALAAVCRLYPRGIRVNGVREISCANSCEAVLEFLLSKKEAIAFQHKDLSISLPEIKSVPDTVGYIEKEQEIRLWLISFMQDRKYPLNVRIMMIGNALEKLEDILRSLEEDKLTQLLGITDWDDCNYFQEIDTDSNSLEKVKALLDHVADGSGSLSGYKLSLIENYEKATQKFEAILPQWEIWFEHILVNHMFFTQFPFDDPPTGFHDKFFALCGVYALMRYLCLGCSTKDIESIVDAVAAIFRLVEHTDFDRYAAQILKKLGCGNHRYLGQILCI